MAEDEEREFRLRRRAAREERRIQILKSLLSPRILILVVMFNARRATPGFHRYCLLVPPSVN
jgi:hypothetical protein